MTGHDRTAEWTAVGLYDPAAPNAVERLALLSWTVDHGATVEQMLAACAEGQLNSLVGDLSLRPGPRLTPREMAVLDAVGVQHTGPLFRGEHNTNLDKLCEDTTD